MKTVLITGVGKGIGHALAEKFLGEGYFVIGTYLSSQPPFTNNTFVGYQLDLSSPKSITSCSKKIAESGRMIDIHINNAGVLLDEEETGVIVDKLRATLEVNLLGTIDFTEHLIPLINNGGHIINTSSSAGSLVLTEKKMSHYPDHYPAYKISKTALNMYTVTLAQRLHKQSITVSSINPGWVKTDMGGPKADLSPEKAAAQIVRFALSHPKTGKFWYASKKMPW